VPVGSVRAVDGRRSLRRALVVSVRPRQWLKNLLVAAAPIASGTIGEPEVIASTAVAFVSFCLVASAVYLVNDVADLAEAVRIANSVRYGLVTSVHTADLGAALHGLDRLDTGMIRINAPTTGVDFHLPFGGTKASGHGPREGRFAPTSHGAAPVEGLALSCVS
jgi:delta 1-pyrroline-5-carboxylate dehydrogenase